MIGKNLVKNVVNLVLEKHMKNIWAVGDLHGHYKELQSLYEKLLKAGLNPDLDDVVFLGDYVDGGPDTADVIEWCIEKDQKHKNWHFLYGNHEDLMIDALGYIGVGNYQDYYLWYGQGGKQTANSYKRKYDLSKFPQDERDYRRALIKPIDAIPDEHLMWLKERPFFYETEDYFFVHAGVDPFIPLEQQKKEASKNQCVGNQSKMDMIWIRDVFIKSDQDWGKKIIFGHTTFPYAGYRNIDPEMNQREGFPFVMHNKIGIDGMAHDKGRLICVKLPEEVFYYSHEY